MEGKIRDIVSVFINVPSDQIGPATGIGRSAVKSSILLHRMYAKLQEEGILVDNYSEIRTFSDLLDRNRKMGDAPQSGEAVDKADPVSAADAGSGHLHQAGQHIGIDIEEIAAMPESRDFRKEPFYSMNFTPSEIAYCILQADAYASFAGLFTAKEAIIKAGLQTRPFNKIEISHLPDGKPVFPDFQLSISHAGPVAVAVAVGKVAEDHPVSLSLPAKTGASRDRGRVVSWLALLLSAIAIILIFTR